MKNCIFCKIIQRTAPASVVYEDDSLLGFLDINPINPGHTLIVPKVHSSNLAELPEATGQHIWTIAQRTAKALYTSALPCEGVNLFLADGEVAFQEVFHVHLHVLPRLSGDSFRIEANWDVHPPRDELNSVAERLKAAF